MVRRRDSALLVVGVLGTVSALVMICILSPPRLAPSELLGLASIPLDPAETGQGRESMLHLLTPHERAMFRAQRGHTGGLTQNMLSNWVAFARTKQTSPAHTSSGHAQPAIQARASAVKQISSGPQMLRGTSNQQMLGSWPYPRPDGSAKLDTLGEAIHTSNPEERKQLKHYILNELNQPDAVEANDADEAGREEYSEDNPPCYTPADCEQRAQANGYWGGKEASKLPIYDNDTMEFLAAMQQQDRMILDHKKDKERRDSLGSEAPQLPQVTCGSQCFEARAVWCCRLHQHAIPAA